MKTKFSLLKTVPLLILALLTVLYYFSSFKYLDNKFQDMLYQQAGIPSLDIYVLGIDEQTLKDRDITRNSDGTLDYGDGGLGHFNTWTREDIANIINTLNADPDNKPAVIGIDIVFSGHKTEAEDKALVAAAKEGGNVVMAAIASFGQVLSEDKTYFIETVKTFEEPFEELRQVVDIGLINTTADDDGVVRHAIDTLQVNDSDIPSFTKTILQKYYEFWAIDLEMPKPPLFDDKWFIPFTGEPYEYFGSSTNGNSVIRLLNGEIDPSMFAGSIVLIGPYSYGMMDSYFTPMSGKVQMHGIEIHANILDALMNENFKSYVPRWLELIVILALAALCYVVSLKLEVKYSLLIVLAVTAIYIFIANVLYDNGFIITLIYPVVAIGGMYVLQIGLKYVVERIEKQKIKGIFSKYVDSKLVDELIKTGIADSNEVGKTKDIAVLFVDVRGFTPMSEKLKDRPDRVVEILNNYLELTSTAIFENGGSVDKFIGDATMALFNGFVPLEDYVFKAVSAALDIVKGAKALNQDLLEKYGVNVGFGVGVNCGMAVVGNLGPSFRKDFTAIGDTVNTTARLESNAGAGKILIGEEVYFRLKDRIKVNPVGEIPLKGKSIGLMVYELIDIIY